MTAEPLIQETPPQPPLGGLHEGVIKRIPLSFIRDDHGTQVRGAVSAARVRDLTALLNETEADLDPIDVYLEPGTGNPSSANPVWLSDGFHRVAVYSGLQKPKIPARIHFGGKSEAIEFGLKRNGRHGSPMSNKEKRAAAELAVMDPRIGAFTDQKIARLIGVSSSFVNTVRRGVSPGPKQAETEEIDLSEQGGKKKRSRKTAASGKRESESTAPRSATARERRDNEALNRPTKAVILKRIETELNTDMIDEQDLLNLMRSPTGRYVFLPNDGFGYTLNVVGVTGKQQVSVNTSIKEVAYGHITLRYTHGKLKEA